MKREKEYFKSGNPAIEEGLTSLGLSVGGTGAHYSKKKQFGFNPNCFFSAPSMGAISWYLKEACGKHYPQ